jgi:hypothetical protein
VLTKIRFIFVAFCCCSCLRFGFLAPSRFTIQKIDNSDDNRLPSVSQLFKRVIETTELFEREEIEGKITVCIAFEVGIRFVVIKLNFKVSFGSSILINSFLLLWHCGNPDSKFKIHHLSCSLQFQSDSRLFSLSALDIVN